MSRTKLPVLQERIAPFDLEAFVKEAAKLHQRTFDAFTIPFPKPPDRWLSHDQVRPGPLAFTAEGEVEGGLSWLIGSTIALRFTRFLFARDYSKEGGHSYDPASACFLELASRVERYPNYASCGEDWRQQDKGRRSGELAGLHEAIPGEDDLSHFCRRVDSQAIEAALAVFVGLFRAFGLMQGERLSTDGQLEPSCSRVKGCASCCQDCQQRPLDETSRQELSRPLQAGAQRLAIRCPFPAVVHKVLHATRQKGTPREPNVALLEIESVPADRAKPTERQQLSEWLCLPTDQLPPLRLTWSHLPKGPPGELWGSCPTVPADLDARGGDHIDNTDPPQTERVVGYLQQKTTSIDVELGLE